MFARSNRWALIAALAIFIFSVEVSRAEIATSSRVDISTSVNIPGEEPRSGVIITDGVSVSETLSVEGGFASATADSSSLQASASGRSSVPGAMVGSGATGSTNIFVLGATYAITGVYGTSGGGLVSIGPANFDGAGIINPNSWNITSGTSLTLRAHASSGSSNPNDYANGHAAITFATYLVNEIRPPIPGSGPDNYFSQTSTSTPPPTPTPIEDDEDIVSPPKQCAGCAALVPIFDSFGVTHPIYIGPPVSGTGSVEDAGGGASADAIVTAYRYRIKENLLTHFILPAAFPGGDNELQVQVDGNVVPYTPGELFDLTQYVPGGVDTFKLSGIDVSEDFRLDEVTPFVSGMRFANNGIADVRIRPANWILTGDYNDDGTVDAADYVVWRKNVGTENSLDNDLLGGEVGADHYGQWRAHFGESVETRLSGASPSPSSAPEPSGLLVAAIGGIISLSFARRSST